MRKNRVGMVVILMTVLLLVIGGCKGTSDLASPGRVNIPDEEPDFFHVDGTRYAESIPGTDMYYVYEVHFQRVGEEVTYTLEEMLDMEEMGLLNEQDSINRVWIRSENPVPQEDVLDCGTTIMCTMRLAADRQPCPPCETWNPTLRKCECNWGCWKCKFRDPPEGV